MKTYQVCNQHGAAVYTSRDFTAAVRWAEAYCSGRWSVKTIENGRCVIERSSLDITDDDLTPAASGEQSCDTP